MIREDFEQLKVGDIVLTNKKCKKNSGIMCKVINIRDDFVTIKPLKYERLFDMKYTSMDVSYYMVKKI